MPTSLPLPPALWPKDEAERQSLSDRLGENATLVDANEAGNGAGASAESVGWRLVYPAEFFSPYEPRPVAPTDPRVRRFLEELARTAAKAWARAYRDDAAARTK